MGQLGVSDSVTSVSCAGVAHLSRVGGGVSQAQSETEGATSSSIPVSPSTAPNRGL